MSVYESIAFCKCDRSLSQDSIRKVHYFQGFCIWQQIREYFLLFLDLRDKQKSLAKKFVSLAQNPCFTKSFPQLIRPVYDTESARYCQQFCKSVSMKMFGQSEHDTKSSFMEWCYQEHVSRLCHPSPLPSSIFK